MKEMASLSWDDIDLAKEALIVRAHKGKSKRDDWIALCPEVVQTLRRIRPANAMPADLVFQSSPTTRTLSADLKRAGIAEYDAMGRRVDRHALRTTTGTLLAQSGVMPQQAQRQMRHADISTTLRHYTDLRLPDQAKAAAKLPPIGPGSAPEELDESFAGEHSVKRARTADQGHSAPAKPQHWPQHSLHNSVPSDSKECDGVRNEPVNRRDSKTRSRPAKRDVLRTPANGFEKAGDRDRTDDIQLGNAPGFGTETRKRRYHQDFRIASDAGSASDLAKLRAERGVSDIYTAQHRARVVGSSVVFRQFPVALLESPSVV